MPDRAPTVSVVIAARDAAATIGTTLRSLVSERAVVGEILLVDDASNDETIAVAVDAAAKLALPLTVLDVNFQNAGACRNAGIASAKGEFLYLLDADDEVVAGGLTALVDRLRTNPGAGIAIGGYVRRTDGCRDKIQWPRPYVPDRSVNARRYLLNKLRTIAIGSALVRRRSLASVRFPETIRFEEDALFWAALLATADVVAIRRVVMIYHFDDGRALDRLTMSAQRDFPRFLEELSNLKASGIEDSVLAWRKSWLAFRVARALVKAGDAASARRFMRVAAAHPRLLPRLLTSRYAAAILLDHVRRWRNAGADNRGESEPGAPAWAFGPDVGGSSLAVTNYLINLDRSRERLAYMDAAFKRLGVPYERVSAIDGRLLDASEIGSRLSRGEVGNLLSHKLAWTLIVRRGHPHAAIFEDDACLAQGLARLLPALSWIPADADIVKLDTMLMSVNVEPRQLAIGHGLRLRRLLSTHWGSAGYILSAKGARKLCDMSVGLARPTDALLFEFGAAAANDLVVYQADPALCRQAGTIARPHAPSLPSLIEQDRRLRQSLQPRTFPSKVLREARKLGNLVLRSAGRRVVRKKIPFAETASSSAVAQEPD